VSLLQVVDVQLGHGAKGSNLLPEPALLTLEPSHQRVKSCMGMGQVGQVTGYSKKWVEEK
jgi:hypothetical protein